MRSVKKSDYSNKVIIFFEPTPNFEEEFKNWVGELLNCEEKNEKLYQNTQRNTGGTCQNEVK